jgi:hypothetical protein
MSKQSDQAPSSESTEIIPDLLPKDTNYFSLSVPDSYSGCKDDFDFTDRDKAIVLRWLGYGFTQTKLSEKQIQTRRTNFQATHDRYKKEAVKKASDAKKNGTEQTPPAEVEAYKQFEPVGSGDKWSLRRGTYIESCMDTCTTADRTSH